MVMMMQGIGASLTNNEKREHVRSRRSGAKGWWGISSATGSILWCECKHDIAGQITSTFPFLNLAISEMQKTSHWPTHRWNVMGEQRKSNWQHPNTYYREREETEHSATDECDTSRHPHPYPTLSTKALQIMADPGRNVILEAVHFLVEIRNPGHSRSIGMHSIRS
jgi:hypothetical protein